MLYVASPGGVTAVVKSQVRHMRVGDEPKSPRLNPTRTQGWNAAGGAEAHPR